MENLTGRYNSDPAPLAATFKNLAGYTIVGVMLDFDTFTLPLRGKISDTGFQQTHDT